MRKIVVLSMIAIALVAGMGLVSAGYGAEDNTCDSDGDYMDLASENSDCSNGEPEQERLRDRSYDENRDGVQDRQRLKDGSCCSGDEENECNDGSGDGENEESSECGNGGGENNEEAKQEQHRYQNRYQYQYCHRSCQKPEEEL